MSISITIENEKDFLKACIAGEEWAQRALYEKYYAEMYKVCLRYAKSDMEALDILHDGFIKVFRYIAKYKEGTSLTAWIKRIMINTSIDHYRKESRRRTEDIDQAYSVSSMDPNAIDVINEKEVLKALQQLPPSYRAVFNLYVIEGYSHKEIGEQLNITDSTSRSHLVKARKKLMVILSALEL